MLKILPISNNSSPYNTSFKGKLNKKTYAYKLIAPIINKRGLESNVLGETLAAFIKYGKKHNEYKEYKFIREISQKEYKALKKQISKAINKTEDLDTNFHDINIDQLNKYNVQFLKTILNNGNLYRNPVFANEIKLLLSHTSSKDNAEAKMAIIERYLHNDKILFNKDMNENIGLIVYNTHTKEASDAKLKIINKYIEEEKLNTNHNYRENLPEIIDETNNLKISNIKINIIDKILSSKKLYENQNIKENIGTIINKSNSYKIANVKWDLLNSFIKNKRLNNNKNLSEHIGEIVANSTNELPHTILCIYSNNKNLYKNDSLKKNIGNIIYTNNTNENAKEILYFFKKYISSEKFYANPMLNKNVGYVLNSLGTKMMSTMCSVFDTNDASVAKMRFYIYDLYLNEPLLFENINFSENLQKIIESINSNIDAETKYHTISKYLNNESMHNNPFIAEIIGDIVKHAQNNNLDIDDLFYAFIKKQK